MIPFCSKGLARLHHGLVLLTLLSVLDSLAPAEGDQVRTEGVETATPRLLLAVEDTLDLTDLLKITPLDVRADRLRIGEIVQRCIEREEELSRRIESHVYTQFMKTVFHVGGYGEEADKLYVMEEVDRVLYRKPDRSEVIPLKVDRYVLEKGQRRNWDEESDEEGMSVGIRYEDFDALPFYLEGKDDYDFRILTRMILGDRVIYEVHLTPKSDFEIAPEGTIWIDTSNFQILREEFDFKERVPLPMVVKSIGPFVRERDRIGDLWVWKRVMVRADLRIGWLRFLADKIPDTVEFVLLFRDHTVNGEPQAVPADAGVGEGGR